MGQPTEYRPEEMPVDILVPGLILGGLAIAAWLWSIAQTTPRSAGTASMAARTLDLAWKGVLDRYFEGTVGGATIRLRETTDSAGHGIRMEGSRAGMRDRPLVPARRATSAEPCYT